MFASVPLGVALTSVGAPFDTTGRHGSPRSEPQGGYDVGIPAGGFGITGSTTSEGRPVECAISLTTVPEAGRSVKAQNGRFPPGASTVIRRREPARKMCAKGNSATRAATNCPAGSGAADADVCGCTGCSTVDDGSSARCDARSHPFCTYSSLPSGRSSESVTSRSVSSAVERSQTFTLAGPAVTVVLGSG